MRCGVLLLAAGGGRRFGSRLSKQFLDLDGAPLFVHSLRVFSALREVKEILLVVPESSMNFTEQIVSREKIKKPFRIIAGGAYRGESVSKGLRQLSKDADIVLVHDAARPLVSRDVVRRVMNAAKKHGAALAAWPLSDTLKGADGQGRVKKTISRSNLWCAQTPQGFRRSIADKCLLKPSPTATDDAELAERKGVPVFVVSGSPLNIKITYPHDLILAKRLKSL
jgi:2-C-methyl-D-erythritol 4-phosphate cytidylyltransferase